VVNVLFLYSIQGKSAEMGACVKMLDLAGTESERL